MTDASSLPPAAPVDADHIVAERRAKLAALRASGVAYPNDFERVHLAGDLTVDLAGCDVAAHVAPQRWRCVVSGLGGLVTRIGHDDDGNLILAFNAREMLGARR